jgi:hypothetical protein
MTRFEKLSRKTCLHKTHGPCTNLSCTTNGESREDNEEIATKVTKLIQIDYVKDCGFQNTTMRQPVSAEVLDSENSRQSR